MCISQMLKLKVMPVFYCRPAPTGRRNFPVFSREAVKSNGQCSSCTGTK